MSSSKAPAANGTVKRPPLITLVMAAMITNASLNMLVPAMPAIGADLQATPAAVQLTLTMYLLGFACGQLFYGPLSDHYGRRPILMLGLAGYLLGALLALLANAIELLILARAGQAFCGCAGMVLTRAIVRDVYDREQTASALGFITMAMVIGPAISPFVGGLFDQYLHWRGILVLQVVFGAAVLATIYFTLNETHFKRTASIRISSVAEDFLRLLRVPAFVGYVFSIGFTASAFYTFLGGAPHVADVVIGADPAEYGAAFLLLAAGYSSGNFCAGRLAKRVKLESLILIGLTVAAFGAGLLLVIGSVDALSLGRLFLPMMVVTFGNGLSQPTTMAAAVSVVPELAGSASGLLGFMQMAIAGAASFIVGLLLADSALPMLAQIALAVVLAGLSYLCAMRAGRPRRDGA